MQSEKKSKHLPEHEKIIWEEKNPKAKFHYLSSPIGSHTKYKWLAFLHRNSWHDWRKDLRRQSVLSVPYFNVCSALFDLETTQRYLAFCLLYKDSLNLSEGSRFQGVLSKVQLHLCVSHKETRFPVSYVKLSL